MMVLAFLAMSPDPVGFICPFIVVCKKSSSVAITPKRFGGEEGCATDG